MLLRKVLRRAWAEMPPSVLESPLTSSEGRDLPSTRCAKEVLRQMVPRRSAQHSATYLIKDPARWESDIPPSATAEIEELLREHHAQLEATADMFELLPRLAAEEDLRLPEVGQDEFFRLAYRAAVRQVSGCEVDGAALTALVEAHYGARTAGGDAPRATLYTEVLRALAEPSFRATLQGVLDKGRAARADWQAPAFVPEVWDVLIPEIHRLLADPDQPCLVAPDGHPGWDAVLDAGANRWGLRRAVLAEPVVLGDRVPNALPAPLDRTVAERLGSLLGRGSDAKKLREAGHSPHELLLEAAARAEDPLGLSEFGSRSVLALGLFAAILLQAEEPNEVTARYGSEVTTFGQKVSRGFGSMRRLLEHYDPTAARVGEGGGDNDRREGDLGELSGAGVEDFLIDRGCVGELQRLLSEEAAGRLAVAMWTNVQRREVLALAPLTVAEACDLISHRAVHVSNEMSVAFRKRVAADAKRTRLIDDILAVLKRLPPSDAEALASLATLPEEMKERLQAANEAARRKDPGAEWVSAAVIRRFLRRHSGNG